LGDEELALVASRFTRFHNNRLSQRRGRFKDGCFNCSNPNHFIANCTKKDKQEADPRDHHSGRHKGKHSSGKHKSNGGFDKETLKKKYYQKAKIKERAFLASINDLDHDFDESASSSRDEEFERHVEDNSMACASSWTPWETSTPWHLVRAVRTSYDKVTYKDSTSEVSHSANDLAAEVEELNVALASQDKMLRLATHERKEFKSIYESTLRELESARASVVVSDETECVGAPYTC
jgi:hypothetical protein